MVRALSVWLRPIDAYFSLKNLERLAQTVSVIICVKRSQLLFGVTSWMRCLGHNKLLGLGPRKFPHQTNLRYSPNKIVLRMNRLDLNSWESFTNCSGNIRRQVRPFSVMCKARCIGEIKMGAEKQKRALYWLSCAKPLAVDPSVVKRGQVALYFKQVSLLFFLQLIKKHLQCGFASRGLSLSYGRLKLAGRKKGVLAPQSEKFEQSQATSWIQ